MITHTTWEVRAERFFQMNRIALALFVTMPDDRRMVAKPVELVEYKPNINAEPMCTLSHEEAQLLMNDLWRAGVRPTEIGTAGQLAAVQHHLEDMRRIAFGLIDLKGPKP